LKGRVPDTNGMVERKEKEHGEEGQERINRRNTTRGTCMPVKKWKD
jgi:hypothetical protein